MASCSVRWPAPSVGMLDSTWPDGVDLLSTLLFLALVLVAPALGYVFMVVDYRAYLRSLRRYVEWLISRIPNRAVLMRHRTFSSGLTLLLESNISHQDSTRTSYA